MAERGLYFDISAKKPQEKTHLILVEGIDDARFFDALLNDLEADPSQVAIEQIGGIDKIRNNLQSLVKSRPYQERKIRKIAAIRDADLNPAGAVDMMHRVFQSVDWPTPAHGNFEGGEHIEVGLFVVPSANTDGDIERMCLGTVENTAKANAIIDFYNQMDLEYGPLDRAFKRQCAIYLACTNVETRGPGQAFASGVFDRGHQSLANLRQFLIEFLG